MMRTLSTKQGTTREADRARALGSGSKKPEKGSAHPHSGSSARAPRGVGDALTDSHLAQDFSQVQVRHKAPSRIQAKLTQGRPGDLYEEEADRVADQVMDRPAQADGASSVPRIQRFTEHSGAQEEAPADIDQALAGPSSPLEPTLRKDMERRFDQDFSQVRTHVHSEAGRSAQRMNAQAYTVGHHVVFAPGRFSPGTREGRRLLAHELTHVVQQRAAPVLQQAPEIKAGKPHEDSGLHLSKEALAKLNGFLKEAGQQLEKNRQQKYARSIVGDFVRSDLLLSMRSDVDIKTEKYGDSSLRTETYYILVEQKPDPKHNEKGASKTWSLIVDRRTDFALHGKQRGHLLVRDAAQLASEAQGKNPKSLVHAPTQAIAHLDPDVVFDAPYFKSVPLKANLPKASAYAEFISKHPLLSLSASAKQRIEALEKLLPHPTSVPTVSPKTAPGPNHPQITTLEHKPVEEEPEEIIKPDPKKPRQKVEVQSPSKFPQSDLEIKKEIDKDKDDEDHWYSGLLRALAAIGIGLAVLAIAAAAVAGLVFLATGVVISATVAVAIAAAALFAYGFVSALRHRMNQDAYKGKPGAGIGRAFLDAIGVTGVQEAWTGKEVGTGKKLSSGERVERGVLGGFNLLTLLLGARGLLKEAPIGEVGTEPAPSAPKASRPKTLSPLKVPPDQKMPTPSADAPIKPTAPAEAPKADGPGEPNKTPEAAPQDEAPQEKPKDKVPETPKPRSRQQTRVEDPQRGVRAALERLEQKIDADLSEISDQAKEIAKAQRKQAELQQKIQKTPRSDPNRALDLETFKAEKARLEELKEQQQHREDLNALDRAKRDQLQAALNAETYARPSGFPAGAREKVWANALGEGKGKVFSPSGKEIPNFKDSWIMGHKPKFEFWKHQRSAAERGISRDQFIREYNEPSQYRPETPEDSSSHFYEDKTDAYSGP
jgi:Domain of unknown function (DUF4157)/HNH/ENDO VII superfamily nuclease with conserved GHE residues